ncbi:MAG: FKBP-type peptidyl-prolyl cis-trans isomerase [Lentimicrobiaceae bacterium]|nr:FKBP-type peptidyl-prolyl cis-trans isomerase [Lentimicrobiaceae bacterium]
MAQKKNKKQTKPEQPVQELVVLNTWMDTISYLVGHDLGLRLPGFMKDVNLDILTQAIRDGFNGVESKFDTQQTDSLMTLYQTTLAEEKQKQDNIVLEQNKAATAIFLAENRTKNGVLELPSGLQYKMIEEGEGESPLPTSQVTVHYKGTLIDGTVFDSSYDRGQPITFQLDGVIPGWTEGLQLMKPGGKCILYVPPQLGYGDQGVGPIPPGSTLIFEIELLSFE